MVSLFRLSLARAVIAVGFVLMAGSAIAVPLLLLIPQVSLAFLIVGCVLVMLTGFGLTSVGDRIAPLVAELHRRPSGQLCPTRYEGVPVRLRR
jgi:hypothetical protein